MGRLVPQLVPSLLPPRSSAPHQLPLLIQRPLLIQSWQRCFSAQRPFSRGEGTTAGWTTSSCHSRLFRCCVRVRTLPFHGHLQQCSSCRELQLYCRQYMASSNRNVSFIADTAVCREATRQQQQQQQRRSFLNSLSSASASSSVASTGAATAMQQQQQQQQQEGGLFRLLNDAKREILKEQRHLTEQAVRLFGFFVRARCWLADSFWLVGSLAYYCMGQSLFLLDLLATNSLLPVFYYC